MNINIIGKIDDAWESTKRGWNDAKAVEFQKALKGVRDCITNFGKISEGISNDIEGHLSFLSNHERYDKKQKSED